MFYLPQSENVEFKPSVQLLLSIFLLNFLKFFFDLLFDAEKFMTYEFSIFNYKKSFNLMHFAPQYDFDIRYKI